jgi:outer membrane protein assembly factor BamB
MLAPVRSAADEPSDAAAGLRGLCVHLGAGDGRRTVALAKAGESVVHALATNAATVAATVMAAGLDDRTSVEPWVSDRLPYSDRSVDLVVAEAGCGVDEAEIRRVLTPGGRALIANSSGWRTVSGKPAAGADSWTHSRHGADANPVSCDAALTRVSKEPPDRLRWINDVTKIWPHAFRVAGDSVFLFRAEQAMSDGRVIANTPMSARVRCRSAWNGTLLWDGLFPDVAPHNGMGRPVATAARVYLHNKHILAVDAATGKEVAKSDLAPFSLIVPDDGRRGVVVARTAEAIVGLDGETLAERWRVELPLPASATKAQRGLARAWSVTVVVADATTAYTVGDEGTQRVVRAIALNDGKARPLAEGFNFGEEAWPMLVSEHVLVVAGKGYVAGIPADGRGAPWRLAIRQASRGKDGKVALSDADVASLAMTCSLVHEGRLWMRDSLTLVFGDAPQPETPPAKVGWTGIDLKRGVPVAQIGYPTERPWGGINLPENATGLYVPGKLAQPSGRNWSHRCYADVAFPNAILSQTAEIVGFAGEEPLHLRGVRGQCGIGFGLGAGALFTPPNQCIGCYPMIRGMNAYEPRAKTGLVPVADAARLERGPAYGAVTPGSSATAGWPMYRGNVRRTGCSDEDVNPGTLVTNWCTATPGRATQAVVSEGALVVAAIVSGRITALDSATGARRWEYALPSRVDTAPTISGGMVFAGCHDGRVYALALADGRLVWRFTAALGERRIVAGDRVESPWPVMGAVLAHDGLVHVVAGHHTSVEGGLLFWGLDPATGDVRYRQTFTGIKGSDAVILPTHWYRHEEVALNNVLLGGKVGQVPVIRLYDEWGGWDFRSQDGTLLRQHQAVPQPGWPKERVSPGPVTEVDRWPWVGHDRVTAGMLLRGESLTYRQTLETDPRTRFSGSTGRMFVCPRPGARLALLMVGGGWTKVDPEPWIVPTDPKVFSEPKNFAEDPARKAADTWAPKGFPVEAAGATITNEKVLWLTGRTAAEGQGTASTPPGSALIAVSMDDGQQLGRWDFPGDVAFEGLSVAGGRIYIVQTDGTVRCFESRAGGG